MKKAIFTIVIAICTVAFINAQDLTSKKGVPILPQAGDYSIGINAVPFFDFIGNAFNGNVGNNAPTWDFQKFSPMTISGKYFKDANTAYRVNFRIGNVSTTAKAFVPDATASVTDSLATVTNKFTNTQTTIALGVGLEKRRGHGRVQGIYGADVALMLDMEKDKWTYGNDITATYNPGVRRVKETYPMMFGIGVRGFVGVEYFFAPCMSIGGEFGWGIAFMSMGKGKLKREKWDGTGIVEWERETAGGSQFYIDTDNWNGAINLNFYF